MKRAGAILLLVGCAFALAEPQLAFEAAWPRLDRLHGPHSGGVTLPDWRQEYYIEEVEVPEDTAFSMTYVLPPGGQRFFIQTPRLPFLEDLTPFAPYHPGDLDGRVPWKR